MSDEEEGFNVSAPWSWNARRFLEQGLARREGAEFLLYSDSHFTGGPSIAAAPYVLTNCLGLPDTGHMGPALALYLDDHFPEFAAQPMDKTDTEGWLNLTLDDEIACVLSLVAGVRLRSGGLVRRFDREDPRGTPQFYAHAAPDWVTTQRPVFPTKSRIDMTQLDGWLDRYLALGREDSVVLVRAARQYRDALWVADTDPELAWLLLVSALEVIAGREALRDADPAELLRQIMPTLAEQLLAAGGEDHLASIAPLLAPVVKATGRFLACVEIYHPEAPSVRPEEYAQVNWEWPSLRKSIAKVYGYRSARLHSGVPFPSPLCQPPMPTADVLDERPSGIAAAAGNAAWVAKDLPMHLHTFGYIVRGCLLKWWQASTNADGQGSSSGPGRASK
ncbi:hypothetical protein ACPYPE_23880 [Streptomyces griseus]|uniref:hypothetical protein n=1 Tax=Streptomyces griseus TaxID=1911 RepID=UPI003CF3F267